MAGATVGYAEVVSFEYERLVRPPKIWVVNVDGREYLITLFEGVDQDLLIGEILDSQANKDATALWEDPEFTRTVLTAIEGKIRDLKLDFLSDLVSVLIKDDIDRRGEESYSTFLRRYGRDFEDLDELSD